MRWWATTAKPCDERIELAAKADAEGRIEERRHKCESGGDQAEQRDACGEADRAGNGEDEADELGELQRWDGFAFGDRAEPGCDEALKDQAVRVLAGSAPRADREDHRLQAENHGRTGID